MLLLVALVGLGQDAVAEEMFFKLEEAALKAKSLHVRAKGTVADGDATTEFSWSLDIRENKANMDVKFPKIPDDPSFLVSDGTTSRMRVRGGIHAQTKSPEHLGPDLRLLFLRGGTQGAAMLVMDLFTVGKELGDPEVFGKSGLAEVGKLVKTKTMRLSEDKDGKVLSFVAVIGIKNEELETKMWIDPKISKPLKRTVVWKGDDGKPVTLTELYEEYALNGEIPDEKFTLPGEKR